MIFHKTIQCNYRTELECCLDKTQSLKFNGNLMPVPFFCFHLLWFFEAGLSQKCWCIQSKYIKLTFCKAKCDILMLLRNLKFLKMLIGLRKSNIKRPMVINICHVATHTTLKWWSNIRPGALSGVGLDWAKWTHTLSQSFAWGHDCKGEFGIQFKTVLPQSWNLIQILHS